MHSWNPLGPQHCVFEALTLQARLSLLRALAALWGLTEDQVQQYSVLNKPSLQTSQAEISLGRAILPALASQSIQPGLTPASSNKVCHPCRHSFSPQE